MSSTSTRFVLPKESDVQPLDFSVCNTDESQNISQSVPQAEIDTAVDLFLQGAENWIMHL
jgi:hypothetical protein